MFKLKTLNTNLRNLKFHTINLNLNPKHNFLKPYIINTNSNYNILKLKYKILTTILKFKLKTNLIIMNLKSITQILCTKP